MTAHPVDAVLVVTWLVFAHLVADFVLQNDWIAINKATGGRLGWSALGVHGLHVALCLVPVVFAYGMVGFAYLLLVSLSHMAVDRWKVQATRLAERRAQARARDRAAHGALPDSGLGTAWTAWPGMLFLADQALHITIALVGWLVLLEGASLGQGFVDFVNAVTRTWDPATFHAATLTAVVLVSLFVVNTRGAFYFAMALVSPRNLADQAEVALPPAPPVAPTGAAARIAAATAAIERLLIATLVLIGAPIVAGLVVALDVAAQWRRLQDARYAEYYLLATLGSIGVALGSALLAQAVLASLG